MNTYKCGACSQLLSDGIHCTVCAQELHFHCAGITEAGFRKLGDRKLTWRCMKCKQPGPTGPSQPSTSPSPKVQSESLILNEIRALSAKLAPLECLREEVMALRLEFADLKSSVNEANKELKEFNTKVKSLEHRIVKVEKVQSQVELLHTRLDKLEDEANSKEQWSRMNNIEIKGVTQTNNENLYQILTTIGSKIQYPISKSQINFIARVPTREKENTKPIIVCFCNRYVKEDFIAAARYASKSSTMTTGLLGLSGNHKIYVNDHLTIQNKALLSKTKKAAAEMDFRYVWIKHAKIHTKKTDTSPTIVIKTEKDLSKMK